MPVDCRLLQKACLVLLALYFLLASGSSTYVTLMIRTILILLILYATGLLFLHKIYYPGYSASYQARHRTSSQLITSLAIATTVYSALLASSIAILSPNEGIPQSSLGEWHQFRHDSRTASRFAEKRLPHIYHHTVEKAYTALVIACKIKPGMTAVIQEPWDRISNMSVAFKLDKHNENCRCWKEKERKDDDVDDKASATTNKTLLEIQEHFRTKTIDLATHMTEYIESIMQVEQKINQTITHGIMTSFDSIQHKIQHIISDTAALRPGSKNVAYRWKSRIVAFYSSSQPTPGLFPSSSSSTSSPISTFLRLQIAIFTQPIFTILRPILTSTPTLEEELYLALDSKFFDSKFYTQKQDIIDSIKAIGPKRHQAHLHLNSLISDFAVIHAYHPTFVRKFREMKPWLNPYSSLSASKNTKDSSEEVEHTLRSAAAAATTMGNSIDLKQADAADTVWWGPVLTSVIEVRIYGRIKRFARDLRRLQAEGGVLSMADAKMLIDEKGSG